METKPDQAETLPSTRTGWGLATGIALPAALLILGLATKELGWMNPAVMAAWLCLAPVAVHLGFRFRKDVAAALAPPPLERRSVIVGANSLGRQFRRTLASLPGASFRGFFDDRATGRLGLGREEPLLGSIDNVARILKEQRIDVVYIALPIGSQSRTAELLAGLKDTTASVYFVPVRVYDRRLLVGVSPGREEERTDGPTRSWRRSRESARPRHEDTR